MWTLFFAGYLFAGRRWCAGYGFWSAERSSSSADFVTGTDTRWRPSAGRGSPPPSRPGSANTRPPDQGEWKEVRLNQVKTGQNSTETSIVADLPACGSNRESCGKSRRRVSVAATGGPVPVARSNGPARAPRDSSATAISSSRRRHSPPKKYRPHPRRCCFCHGIEIRLLFTVPLFHLVAPHQCLFLVLTSHVHSILLLCYFFAKAKDRLLLQSGLALKSSRFCSMKHGTNLTGSCLIMHVFPYYLWWNFWTLWKKRNWSGWMHRVFWLVGLIGAALVLKDAGETWSAAPYWFKPPYKTFGRHVDVTDILVGSD